MSGLADAVGIVGITILIILCAGEPDLLDAIIKRVSAAECTRSNDEAGS